MPNVKLWDSSTPPSKNGKTWLDSKKIAQTYKHWVGRSAGYLFHILYLLLDRLDILWGGKHIEFLVINLPNMVL